MGNSCSKNKDDDELNKPIIIETIDLSEVQKIEHLVLPGTDQQLKIAPFSIPRQIHELLIKFKLFDFRKFPTRQAEEGQYGEFKNEDTHYLGQQDPGFRFNGKGILLTKEFMHIGYFKLSKRNGPGKCYYVSGKYIQGFWKDDEIHSETPKEIISIRDTAQGYTCDATFVKGLKEGQGQETFIDGSSYKGGYSKDKRNGKGVAVFSNGNRYKGEFQDGMLWGTGHYLWGETKSYQGDWVANKMHGRGVFHWADGRSYEGQYQNGVKHGYGIFKWSNGCKYTGYWKNGLQHGSGTYTNGTITETGVWIQGEAQGKLDNMPVDVA